MFKKELVDQYLKLLNPPNSLLGSLRVKCMGLSKETLERKIEDLKEIFKRKH